MNFELLSFIWFDIGLQTIWLISFLILLFILLVKIHVIKELPRFELLQIFIFSITPILNTFFAIKIITDIIKIGLIYMEKMKK
jgi:hypothetical protein